MRQYFNEMTVQGDLVADPSLRYFPDGTAVLRITVETCSEQRDQCTNEITLCKEQHDAVLYGPQAEQVAWSMRQGDALWLRGPLHHRYFRDGVTGRNGTVCEIEVRQVNMLRVRQNDRLPLSAMRLSPGLIGGQGAGWLSNTLSCAATVSGHRGCR